MVKILSLVFLFVSTIFANEKYDRKNWKHWIDEDGDGFTTRQEVLIEENLADTLHIAIVKGKFKIIKGLWVCPYTGDSITNPKKLDVDHFVPLGNAWESGGKHWNKLLKEVYANYLKDKDHLVAVKASANRKKGKKSPDKYMPEINKCWYLHNWKKIKKKWKLKMTKDESLFIFDQWVYNKCKL